jgi:hypothetical protein
MSGMDSHSGHGPTTERAEGSLAGLSDPPTAGRQIADAVCVAVLGLLLTFAANAIAKVPATVHAAPGAAAADCNTPPGEKPAPKVADAGPLAGMAMAAPCGEKEAAPQH